MTTGTAGGHQSQGPPRRSRLLDQHRRRRVAHPRHPRRGRDLPHRAEHPRPHGADAARCRTTPPTSGPTSGPSSSAPSGPPCSPSSSPTPLSIGIALFISHYAPRRVAQTLGYIIDLLAAVPSVVFGLWGIAALAPFVQPVLRLARHRPRLVPALRRAGLRHRSHDPHRRHRARRHGHPDHDRHLPRDLPADPAPPRRGRARPRRDALGDDPDGGPAVRPLRHRLRHHARPRSRPRRDPGRSRSCSRRRSS